MAKVSGTNELEYIAQFIQSRFPQAHVSLDLTVIPSGPSFLDALLDGRHVIVEWRPKSGFGISRGPAELFDSGADVVATDRASAEQIVADMLAPFPELPAGHVMVDIPAGDVLIGLLAYEAKELALELTKALPGPFDFDKSVAARLDWLLLSMPALQVELPAYRIDVYPVTIGQWKSYMRQSGAAAPSNWQGNRAPYPDSFFVTGVSWKQADAYAKHYNLELPTEFEWEHAARNYRDYFPWGSSFLPEGRIALQEPAREPYAVGSRPETRSRAGIHDLVGYFGEYTGDLLEPYDENKDWALVSHFPDYQKQRAVRGGYDVYQRTSCVYRSGIGEDDPSPSIKFRCVHRN